MGLMNFCLAGFASGLGDGIAQLLIERNGIEAYDVLRTARMAAIGLFLTVSVPIFGPY